MKKLLFAFTITVSLATLASAASAGDLGLAGASYDWSGGYVGVNAGAGFNASTFSTRYNYTGIDQLPDATAAVLKDIGSSTSPSEVAFAGGITAGYNMQYANFVLGAEADFNYAAFGGNARNELGAAISPAFNGQATGSNKITYDENWYGTFRGRAGYAIDNILLYGTAGLAYGEIGVKQKIQASDDTGSVSWSAESDGWKAGWTVGAGIEYGINEWMLGLEYLYVDLNDFGWNSNSETSDVAELTDVRAKGVADYKFNVVRATAKYRF